MFDINPSTTATQLATAYTQGAQELITRQVRSAEGTAAALTRLRSTLQTFNNTLANLTARKSLLQNSATFSQASIGTAQASATAQAGSYSFFVVQLASTHQIAFQNLPAVDVNEGGTLQLQQADGSSFSVDLLDADADGDGTLSQAEIALAINQAAGNDGRVRALIMTVGGSPQLVLTASESGAARQITLDASGLPAGALKDALSTATQLAAARDAVVWMGEQGSGIRLQQSSNTFSAIPGVEVTFARTMSAGEDPVVLTVANDNTSTVANVRSFIDAYNALLSTLNELTRTSEDAASRGAFATDSGVRNLRNRLSEMLRLEFGGARLSDLGISTDRNGSLRLDSDRLNKKLQASPDVLDQVFGSAQLSQSSGVMGAMDRYLKQWLDSSSGHIKRRQDTVQSLQKALTVRQTRLDEQFDLNYERYLQQFSQLQTLMGQMGRTSDLFSQLPTVKVS